MARNQGHVEIRPSRDQYKVHNVAENGEIVKTSERLEMHQSAVKNAKADLNLFGGESVVVRDYTPPYNQDGEFSPYILYADGRYEYNGTAAVKENKKENNDELQGS